MLMLDAAAVARALDWPGLIEALRRAHIEGAEVPPRHHHRIGEAGTLLLMPAWQPQGWLGLKAVNIMPGNTARGLPSLHGLYTLFDATTGQPVATMDGAELTTRRTAATAALAAQALARPEARHLLLLGTGRIARLLPEAFASVLPQLRRVTVWNHRPAGAEALATQLRAQGFEAATTTDPNATAATADLISAATLSTQPLILGDALPPGVHVDLIGSFTPQMREADGRCFARAAVWLDQREGLLKAGDLLDAMAEGHFHADQVCGTLEDLCRQGPPARPPGAITLFKAVGSALADLAAAGLVAQHHGLRPGR